VPLKGIAPGLSVPLIVPLPVTAMAMVLEDPAQIEVFPEMLAIGRAFTFTTLLPVKSPASAVQFASLRVATV
jgi:hypothetical protein